MLRIRTLLSSLAGVYFCTLGVPGAKGETAIQKIESELSDRLRWEVLWKDSVVPFPADLPPRPKAGIYRSAGVVGFCSNELGRCAAYGIEDDLLGQRLRSVACNANVPPCVGIADLAGAASRLVGEVEEEGTRLLASGPLTLGRSLSGVPANSVKVKWSATLSLGHREEIKKLYKDRRSESLNSLTKWLRAELGASDYRFLVLPCFAPSDPSIYVYGKRNRTGEIVISVRWNHELNRWQIAATLEGPESLARISELRGIIEGLSCGLLEFIPNR